MVRFTLYMFNHEKTALLLSFATSVKTYRFDTCFFLSRAQRKSHFVGDFARLFRWLFFEVFPTGYTEYKLRCVSGSNPVYVVEFYACFCLPHTKIYFSAPFCTAIYYL